MRRILIIILIIIPIIITIIISEIVFANLEKIECESQGGIMSQGLSPKPWCNLPTSDGGNECTDSSQCEAWCMRDHERKSNKTVGSCSKYRETLGCVDYIENGEIITVCLD